MLAKQFARLAALVILVGSCHWASAHPMGNFSVNHYSKIETRSDRVIVRYFIDLAEIPTYQELQQGNISTNEANPTSAIVVSYVARRGAELGNGLMLDMNGKQIPLRLVSSGVIFPPGAGGLPTMKMGFVYEAAYPPYPERQPVSLHYADSNYPGHTGWKEIVVVAPAGSLLNSSAPSTDRSGELTNYPTDLLSSPPQDLEVSFTAVLPALEKTIAAPVSSHSVMPVANISTINAREASKRGDEKKVTAHLPPAITSIPIPAAAPARAAPRAALLSAPAGTVHLEANQQKTPRNRFTELIAAQHLSAWFLFTAALIAIGLGGLHALEPGHGKTIVAAYLVGSKGTARHAALLGLIVTVSHTAGVFALGAITLYASRYIVPEQLYPWLGVLSGLTIAGLGCYMLLLRLSGTAAEHSHAAGSSDGHWMFWKRKAGETTESSPVVQNSNPAQPMSMTQLFTLGITGGIIPCPAALIVLLSAFALHRVGLGFFLIVAFSVGLASVLIGFGMLMVFARRFMTHLQVDGPLTRRWLPVASSAFMTILGATLAIQAFATTHVHISARLLSSEKLGPVLFLAGLGLILGMRHSTDADHVVAISTIVSKQRSIRNAAFIGSIWGMGHTITIFIVGSLIILFGVQIPPRLGLSMEFSVAAMLILLGILNLTGIMQKVTNYFAPGSSRVVSANPSSSADGPQTTMESWLDKSVGRFGLYQCLRPLIIGLVHGLAGSAAVALLVLSTIHDHVWATVYLLIFGAGTMLGMMCMTAAIAVPLTFAGDRFAKLGQYLGVASGMASLCFGTFLVYQLGFVGGLFTSHPQWTPR
jgi:ABC-type nickel/cobalt efflux system permease component RcnA